MSIDEGPSAQARGQGTSTAVKREIELEIESSQIIYYPRVSGYFGQVHEPLPSKINSRGPRETGAEEVKTAPAVPQT